MIQKRPEVWVGGCYRRGLHTDDFGGAGGLARGPASLAMAAQGLRPRRSVSARPSCAVTRRALAVVPMPR
eukprot:CAMPEP_0185186032 /NCGR_PEP_ID=MMETSP1140-20130426/3748_1 /TAXON_ID=298111 /ORGANISM="Pavlova sp., Strain CCMP459" /LENGTH=69 /DNA_ID=CAMNT_0027752283 /DNA_START=30 /DNA_END=236 /DNA_ORIENTATION=+